MIWWYQKNKKISLWKTRTIRLKTVDVLPFNSIQQYRRNNFCYNTAFTKIRRRILSRCEYQKLLLRLGTKFVFSVFPTTSSYEFYNIIIIVLFLRDEFITLSTGSYAQNGIFRNNIWKVLEFSFDPGLILFPEKQLKFYCAIFNTMFMRVWIFKIND